MSFPAPSVGTELATAVRQARGEVRRAARASVLLVAAGGVTGILNLLFNVVVARGGGSSAYGAIGSLLTVVTVVGIVATGFQYGIARQAALSTSSARQLLRPAFASVLPWAAAALLLAVLAWPLSSFLRLPSMVPVLLIVAVAVVSVFGAAVSGLLVGLQRFRVIAGLGVGAALLRLGLGFLVGRGPTAVTLSLTFSLAGLVASFVAGLLLLTLGAPARRPRAASPSAGRGEGTARAGGLLGALIAGGLWTVWGLPVLFARHLLAPAAAGDFAATQLLAGALIWGTAPIVTAFFPTIARHPTRHAFLYGEVATLVLVVVGAALLTAVGPILVQHLYGGSFLASRALVGALTVSAAATACATFAAWSAMAGRTRVASVLTALLVGLGSEVAWDLIGAHGPISLAVGPALAFLVGGAAFAAMARRRSFRVAGSESRAEDTQVLAPAAVGEER